MFTSRPPASAHLSSFSLCISREICLIPPPGCHDRYAGPIALNFGSGPKFRQVLVLDRGCHAQILPAGRMAVARN